MSRSVFYSFHYEPDNWRAATVRGIGALEGNEPVSDNDWEAVTKRGDAAIEQWIDEQMKGRSCAVVLIGRETASRKWVVYELSKAWNDGKGVVGIHIHNLLDRDQQKSTKGANPIARVTFKDEAKTPLSTVAKTYDPPHSDSRQVYQYIADNIAHWVEEAVQIRKSK
jgi:hypothetical protein